MNFLAHLWLAGDDEGLRLGAMLGDFLRGSPHELDLPPQLRRGIVLHRFIDRHVDGLAETAALRKTFPTRFRRFSGIILDLVFDHELARRWEAHSPQPLESFDRDVRTSLFRHARHVPAGLRQFMRYADRRGLFASYRSEAEMLHSLSGIGRRLSRPNPLDRVEEIWPEMKPALRAGFEKVFPLAERAVADWLAAEAAGREPA